MENTISREDAWKLLLKYNQDHFHIQHALTVEGVMRWYAKDLGYADEEEYWGIVGLLHDIDFELYPQEHCIKGVELMRENDIDERLIHAMQSHGYGICTDVEPEHVMEKVLYAVDELTGLIGAAVAVRPSKSTLDLETKSLMKKFKQQSYAAACSRDVIRTGAERLGWTLDELLEKTLHAMADTESTVAEELNLLLQA